MRQISKPKGAEAIIHRHHYDIVIFCETSAVVPRNRALTGSITTPMNPDEYRAFAFLFLVSNIDRGGYIQCQAIFAPTDFCTISHTTARNLRCGRAEFEGFEVVEGRSKWLWRFKPQFSHRWFCIGDAGKKYCLIANTSEDRS